MGLIELAERCEAAVGPDRAIDLAISSALNTGRSTDPRNPGPRHYTSSLDAAMTLVPEGWTAWELRTRRGKTLFTAHVSRESPEGEDEVCGTATIPALALTAACLRALAHMHLGDE